MKNRVKIDTHTESGSIIKRTQPSLYLNEDERTPSWMMQFLCKESDDKKYLLYTKVPTDYGYDIGTVRSAGYPTYPLKFGTEEAGFPIRIGFNNLLLEELPYTENKLDMYNTFLNAAGLSPVTSLPK